MEQLDAHGLVPGTAEQLDLSPKSLKVVSCSHKECLLFPFFLLAEAHGHRNGVPIRSILGRFQSERTAILRDFSPVRMLLLLLAGSSARRCTTARPDTQAALAPLGQSHAVAVEIKLATPRAQASQHRQRSRRRCNSCDEPAPNIRGSTRAARQRRPRA